MQAKDLCASVATLRRSPLREGGGCGRACDASMKTAGRAGRLARPDAKPVRSTVVAEPESALRPPPSDRCQACRSDSFRLAAFPFRTFHFLGVWSVLTSVFLLPPLSSPADGYVNAANPTPLAPYTNWATAATVIQDAIDAAPTGGVVWVTNGVYATGGEPANLGTMLTNRARVNKSIALKSVNGPSVTSIVGYGPGNSNAPGAVRCVWLGSGSSVEGFTLTNGHTLAAGDFGSERSGGGAWCTDGGCVVSNCFLVENRANVNGAGVQSGTIVDCTFRENWAVRDGGAMAGATATRCTLFRNWANRGAGAASSTLTDSTIASNQTNYTVYNPQHGGGLFLCTATACDIVGNQAAIAGGGSCSSVLHRCTLRDNGANTGAGAYGGATDNSVFLGNVAGSEGGGAFGGMMTNCTVAANRGPVAGGVIGVTAINSIVWDNRLADGVTVSNHVGGGFSYSCTHPLPAGTGNLNTDPLFADAAGGDFRLAGGSPCLEVGYTPAAVGTLDRAGGPRLNGPVDMGAYEGTGTPELAYLAVSADPVGSGTVTGAGTNFVGTWVSIGATPTSGWVFVDWHDGVTTNPRSVRVPSGGTSYVARFRAVVSVPLTLTADPPEGGTVTGGGMYLEGTAVDIGAAALPGWYFDRWSDGVTNAARTVQVPVGGMALMAQFQPVSTPQHYVSPSGSHASPFATWSTAATNIQAAIDVAEAGDTVLVTNGVYATGGRAVIGTMTNRVTIDKPVRVRSVNGPEESLIVGSPAAGGDVGSGAVRCVWLGSGASLHGFTLTNGFTQSAGDEVAQRSGGGAWGQSTDAVLSNCVVRGNRAYTYGAGVYGGTAFDCRIEGNRVNDYGGGAAYGVLRTCTLSNNVSGSRGGATYSAVLEGCLVAGNQAAIGAGAHGGSLDRCVIRDNRSSGASATGGGLASASARNSVLVRNTTTGDGGGAYASVMSNCTVIANTSAGWGGGVRSSTLINSIVYYNSAPASLIYENHDGGTLTYCCTVPAPPGTGNTTDDPRFVGVGDFHILPGSSCIDAADPLSAPAVDIEGDLRPQGAAPDIGCDEAGSGTGVGAVVAAAYANPTNGFVGAAFDFISLASGPVLQLEWIFDDGLRVTNRPAVSHVFAAAGAHEVRLLATGPEGVSTALVSVAVDGLGRFVSPWGNDEADGTSWATAKATIQAAVDSCTRTDMTVWVTNGVYATGGRAVTGTMTNRVTLDQPLVVRSVNGPAVTHIVGAPAPGTTNPGPGAVRCAWVGTGATLQGFTLTNGFTLASGDENSERSGGGALCQTPQAIVSNCVVAGNSAHAHGGGVHWGRVEACVIRNNRAASGAGVWDNVAVNCFLVGNSASSYGGAAWGNTMTNCTVVGNDAPSVGGISSVNAAGCILWGNVQTGTTNLSNHSGGSFTFTCAQPLPSGTGNISQDPVLVGLGDFHLLSNSPCIDASNPTSSVSIDIEGDARPQGTGPDMGCDEMSPGVGTGVVTVAIGPVGVRAAPGYPARLTSLVAGPAWWIEWIFDDGFRATNTTTVAHSLVQPGFHEVLLVAAGAAGTVTGRTEILVAAEDLYVSPDGTDADPGTNWATAKATIQAAIDASHPGTTVWVTNGVYATGGRAVVGTMTNRVTIDKPVTVRSVNGPEETLIVGAPGSGGGNGVGAVRCVWLGSGSSLHGFTISNGHTRASGDYGTERSGGGIWCEGAGSFVSNCTMTGNGAHINGAGLHWGAAVDCRIVNNVAGADGGGSAGADLTRCVLVGNRAGDGGGAAVAVIADCLVSGNWATAAGGGTYLTTANRSVLRGNTALSGGGASGGALDRCVVRDNRTTGAGSSGGGLAAAMARNSILSLNRTEGSGGGASACLLSNCTVIANGAGQVGGGTDLSTSINSIVYYNYTPSDPTNQNHSGGTLTYCCTVPAPPNAGNITNAPGLGGADNPHLGMGSPCIDAGFALPDPGTWDLDGESRTNGPAVDIGADEVHAGSQTGAIAVAVVEMSRAQTAVFTVELAVMSTGRIDALYWDFGDGTAATNDPAYVHEYARPGSYVVRVRAVNADHEAEATNVVSLLDTVYVSPTGNDAAPGTNWATAKATLQAGVDACMPSGAVVRATNGVYAAGGRAVVGTMTNRLVLDRPVTVIGVGGARSTVILGQPSPQGGGAGDGAIRCVWMTNGAALVGFTLSNGFTRIASNAPAETCGGAVWCATPSCVVSQCVIEGNAAYADGGGVLGGMLAECVVRFNTAQRGGGIASNTAANCLIARNVAGGDGGGAMAARLTHCSVLANRAATAGGMSWGVATNCIVYFNTAGGRDVNYSSSSLIASCMWPLFWGQSNIDADPGLAGVGNPHLMPGSPCIDAGLTPLSTGALDLDGEPRLQGAAVDIGCDEFGASVPTDAPLASILALWTEIATDYGMDFQADTWGQVSFLGWDFGDGASTSGVAGVTHAFAEPGTYEVRLVASNLAGMASSIVTVRVERAERFVSPSGDDLAPGTNWATAKATIQGGVDACSLPGTFVWVTNGTYVAGGRTVGASMTNRVAVDRPVRVFSVGGPAETFIVGARSAGAADGCSTDSVRCVWMTNGAWIAGFTLSNGFSSADAVNTNERSGGGVWCANRSAVLSNCVIRNCGARFSGGGAFMGSLANCEISGCVATNGGGAVDARLDGCLAWSNRADYGAGAYASDSSNSVFRWNAARIQGGGVRGGLHEGGQISGNAATNGGGAYAGILRSCVVADNTAGSMGGGAHSCTQELCLVARNVAGAGGGAYHGLLYNCALVGNRAVTNGGGARSLLLANCTVIGNRAAVGPGTYTSTQLNSIVYFNGTTNGAREEYSGGIFEYSCTTPLPAGAGNITNAPMLAGVDNPRLLPGSPCIDAGTNGYVWGGTDLYGKARVAGGSVDIGCDEFVSGPRTGAVAVSLAADWTAWAAGAPGGFAASTTGAVGMLIWDFGDGVLVTNETAPGHAFGSPGIYDVRIIARNDDAASTGVVQVAIGLSPLFVAPWGDDGWPGTNWATAKATIQAAVDASELAGTVLVTSGVYTAGGRVMEGTLSNRVAIPRRMTVRSVDGPESTFIVGLASPTNNGLGAEAVRCAWLTNDTVLAGFTLTNGFTRYLNLPDATRSPEEIGGGVWCMSGSAVISNCVLVGNGASRGGGAYNGAVVDCEVRSNSAVFNGGGAYYCAATGSLFEGNSVQQYGGAADRGSLERCRVVANRSNLRGGGASAATIRRSTIVGNSAAFEGGGGYNVTAVSCYFYGNSASTGGGVRYGTLTGCTVAGNEATQIAGGASGSTLRNTICFYNGPRGNHSTLTAASSHNCTTPMPPGAGNVTNEPMLAGFGNPHILPGSPCIDAGTNAASMSALDIDGEVRTNGAAVDIGCDEFWLEGCTGAVGVVLSASWTNVAPGYPVAVNLLSEGRITGLAFTHESGVMLTSSSPSYGLLFPGPGVYSLTATATNHDSVAAAQIDILVSTQAFHVAPFGSDAAAGTNWATAKATLQAAVDDYPVLGGTVWVTNGVYDTGGRVISGLQSNRVALPRPVTVRSVNGAGETFIVGLSGPTNGLPGTGAVRCVWMGNGGTLSGFTLTNGSTGVSGDGIVDRSGGGAWCSPGAVIERCRIVQCSATERGGGVYSGNLRSSVLFGNYSGYDGGGAHSSVLLGCSVVSNRARYLAGGVYGGTVTSSIVYFNSANTPNYQSTTMDGSCSLPSQAGIVTTADPGFRNVAEGDLTLSNGSPCINAGVSEPWMAGEVDFAGNPRVIGGTVDIGAYEFAGGATASGIPWQWLLDYDLATDGTADGEDVDGDGQTAYAEQRAGTHPWDPLSALGLGSAAAADLGDGVFPIFRWASVSGRVYRVGLSTNLLVGFDALVADDVPATPPENTVTDRTDAAASFKVYRVEVK